MKTQSHLAIFAHIRQYVRHIRFPALPRRVLYIAAVIALLTLFVMTLGPISDARAMPLLSTFAVTTTTDELDAGSCSSINDASGAGADGQLSLREALCEANNTVGSNTVNAPAGTYNLTLGELRVGTVAGSNITVSGAGAATTIIQATQPGTCPDSGTGQIGCVRVFDIDPSIVGNVTVSISDVTVQNGRATTIGGAGIVAGSVNKTNDNLTLSNCVITSNKMLTTNTNRPGGGVSMFGGNLTLTNCTLSNNSSGASPGGGVDYGVNSGHPGTLTVTNSAFSNNSVANNGTVGVGGGAMHLSGPATFNISGSTFSNNSVDGTTRDARGGAIKLDGGTLTVSNSSFTGNAASSAGFNGQGGALWLGGSTSATFNFDRVVGNSANANSGSGVYASGTLGSFDATNNWWGCNTGPNNAGCDRADSAGATITSAPYIVLTNTASPNPIQVNQSTTLTASFLQNSNSQVLTANQVAVLVGLPVAWSNTVNGSLSNQQATIQANGTATATFTASQAGNGSADTQVDNATVTTNPVITIHKGDTTTTITSDNPDPSVVGQSVTVNYTVTSSPSGATTPSGSSNVTVGDGVDSCTGTVAAGTCNITLSTAGARTLTATYAGDSNFNGSTSANEAHTVNKADTTTSITSDTPDPSVVGQAVNVNYNVAVTAPGAGTPTGNVTVSDGVDSCSGSIAAGTCNITLSTAGARTLTATYAGDSNFNGSTSANEAHTVNKADTTTTITSDNPDPSVVGQSVTVNYNVAVTAPGAGTPTGNVTVSDGTISCTATVAAGSCALTFTSPGARTVTATYAGDSNFNGSTSANEAHTVNKADTTTSITSDNPDPSVVGQSVTVNYNVSVTAPGAGTPTGNVTVSDGTISCTATVAAGSCALTFTSPGARTLTATYAGDGNFNGSTSANEAHTVNKADTTTTITSDNPDPSVVGQSVTVNYNVAVTAPGAGTPTGNVTVSDGTISCTATVAAGSCSLTFTTTGAKNLTATYAGDSNFNGSVSAVEPHTVSQITLSPTTLPDGKKGVAYNQTITANNGQAPYTFAVTAGSLPPGLALSTGGVLSGTPTAIGTYNFTVTATDALNNSGSQSYTFKIVYNFTGFFAPVSNPPTLNIANAGSTVPVKFSLGGDQGLSIFAANSPNSQQVNCGDLSQSLSNDVPTDTSGQSGLTYDATSDTYSYHWKTDKAWAGTCRELIITLVDGTTQVAYFQFK